VDFSARRLRSEGGVWDWVGLIPVREGASATQIVANDSLPNDSKMGDAHPDFVMSFVNNLRSIPLAVPSSRIRR
jgi:hypothetical protein